MSSSEAHHLRLLRSALEQARLSPPTATAYCIGAVLVGPGGTVLTTGYTNELPGNTHAEQCCLEKLLPDTPPEGSVIYTTMEPCTKRLSGNKPCADRILENTGIKTVYVGVKEPKIFVENNVAVEKLKKAGLEYIHIPGLEEEILAVAKRGHKRMEK
jgi:tRNA pseudouridine synthase 8/2,5-diamino-6-(5-phospho-D-ribitylamino)-pyrimidin-4(3H)-one deaminase